MPTQRPLEQSPFDHWVQVALTERYSDALREPVPAALLDLLDQPERG